MINVMLAAGTNLDPTTIWLMVVAAILTIVYAMVRPWMRGKRDPLTRSSPFSSLSQQRQIEAQMNNLLVELAEMARKITVQLDTRSAKLEELIRQADQRIEQMGHVPPVAAAAVPHMRLKIEPDHHTQQVYDLADQGRNVHEISKQLQRPQGEIELILALRKSS